MDTLLSFNFAGFNGLELIACLIGLAYIVLEYKADVRMWPLYILMSGAYILIFWHNRIYGLMLVNLYYVLAGIYGWWRWGKKRSDSHLRFSSWKDWLVYLPATALMSFLFYLFLEKSGSSVPLADSLMTALSLLATWMLACKRIDQWIVWLVVNGMQCLVFYHQGLYPSSVYYGIYTIVSACGFIHWTRLSKQTQTHI